MNYTGELDKLRVRANSKDLSFNTSHFPSNILSPLI